MKKIIKLDGKYLKIDESNLVNSEYDATDFNDVGSIQIVKSDNKLYSVIHGKIDWVIIDISYSTVTLMSLNVLGDVQYAYPMIAESEVRFIEYSSSWKISNIRRVCQSNAYNFFGRLYAKKRNTYPNQGGD